MFVSGTPPFLCQLHPFFSVTEEQIGRSMELPYFKHERPLIAEYCRRDAHVKFVLLLFNCIATGNKVSEQCGGGVTDSENAGWVNTPFLNLPCNTSPLPVVHFAPDTVSRP